MSSVDSYRIKRVRFFGRKVSFCFSRLEPSLIPFMSSNCCAVVLHCCTAVLIRHKLQTHAQVPILCQNENGPCPLLAIGNILLLQSNISIHPVSHSARHALFQCILSEAQANQDPTTTSQQYEVTTNSTGTYSQHLSTPLALQGTPLLHTQHRSGENVVASTR